MNLFSGFADISFWQLIPVAAVALVASVVGGVSGYGTGALMPLVLVPLVGAEPVVPIIAVSAMFTNSSRVSRSPSMPIGGAWPSYWLLPYRPVSSVHGAILSSAAQARR